MRQYTAEDFEKLGVFYLGRERGGEQDIVLYESRDLVTHGVCVGMTGSGKTGLCTVLLEEAAIDGVPAILIDPKGDIANLLLTFPDLAPSDFEPWLDPEVARRRGMTIAELAEAEAEKWARGLQEWGQDGERIRRLQQSANFVIYTPGSTVGEPVSLLSSFAAPPPALREDDDLLAERVSGTATSLLSLMDIEADPLTSQEHILLSNILLHFWSRGQDVDLASLIGSIQEPPLQTIGVMDVESFYPAKRRATLAMRLNSLLAAPSFATWLKGAPMDVDRFLYGDDGRPTVSIFSIAHLAETERMFFVSLLLNHVLGWMRSQSGTSSLRALLYMDEIFGYLPPVAKPPSKKPLMTMLKQGRAFGLGLLLATQNPADIDYKALSNTGTWLLGRLQTERDRARVLDALETAASEAGASTSRALIDDILRGLDSREFVLHNVHEGKEPTVFQTRWALSYLRGPLTRNDLKRLAKQRSAMLPQPPAEPEGSPFDGEDDAPLPTEPDESLAAEQAPVGGPTPVARPHLGGSIPQYFLHPSPDVLEPDGATLLYRPMVYGRARLAFTDRRRDVDEVRECALLCGFKGDDPVPWSGAVRVPHLTHEHFRDDPFVPCTFHTLPPSGRDPKSYAGWRRDLIDHLAQTETMALLQCKSLGLTANPGESNPAFRGRVSAELREQRDRAVEKVRDRFSNRLQKAHERLEKASGYVDEQSAQARMAELGTALDVGSSLLGAFMGTRSRGRLRGVKSHVSKTVKERRDVSKAKERLADAVANLESVEGELEAAMTKARADHSELGHPVEVLEIRTRRADVDVQILGLAWIPYWVTVDGERLRAIR